MSAPLPYRQAASRTKGFTLLEMMLVMTILALMTAMVTPVFNGTLSNMQSENAVRSMVTAMEYAQNRAVTDAKEYRVYLAPRSNQYWVEKVNAGNGSNAPSADAVGDTLPESISFTQAKMQRDKRTNRYYVAFYPNGLCDQTVLALTAHNDGTHYQISTTGTSIEWKKGGA